MDDIGDHPPLLSVMISTRWWVAPRAWLRTPGRSASPSRADRTTHGSRFMPGVRPELCAETGTPPSALDVGDLFGKRAEQRLGAVFCQVFVGRLSADLPARTGRVSKTRSSGAAAGGGGKESAWAEWSGTERG